LRKAPFRCIMPQRIIIQVLMPQFWLRVALVLYGVGLLDALIGLWGGRRLLAKVMIPAVGLGTVVHCVSLAEGAMLSETNPLSSLHQIESLFAFLLMAFFFFIYARYQTASPGIAVFPLVFLLTFSSAFAGISPQSPSTHVSPGWIYMHVGLVLLGYCALFFSFFASILYLIQERNLKARGTGGFWSGLPPLATIDEIGYRSLVVGFPFMTFGFLAGAFLGEVRYGAGYFRDPKILVSILMWVVYTVLLYTRWNVGWRGRRAAYLGAFAFLAAILAFAANT